MSNHEQALTNYIKAFVTELAKSGVENVVISPGSRSTPLAMLIANNKNFKVHIHVDERSAAFFALGIAKATKKPTAILCTSGTAAANYYPAVIEANISRVPLIVLTADRPHELRGVGAPQAIDQIDLYGKHVKWFAEMAIPEGTESMVRYVRSVCGRAVSTTLNAPAGPVHLNFPLREPLIPLMKEKSFLTEDERPDKYVNVRTGVYTLPKDEILQLATIFSKYEKGLIICGPDENNNFINEVTKLAKTLQYPIIADPLSQLRSGEHDGANIITSYDSFLKDERVKDELKPDLIIRFGAMPVSKSTLQFMQKHADVAQFIVDNSHGWRDPSLTSSEMIYCDEQYFCRKISEASMSRAATAWLNKWQKIDSLTKETLSTVNDFTNVSESKLFSMLEHMLPDGSTVFVGNSMPIRDVDTFFHFNNKNIKIMANRGANGIDGVVSTALGVATSTTEQVFLIVGDLTFFHDLNGLLAAKLYDINITIIVINNNGGGIFSFLPQANHKESFEHLFGTPLNIDFSHVVKMYEGNYCKINDWDNYRAKFSEAIEYKGLSVLEISTNRDENLVEHRDLWENVSREINLFLDDIS